MGGNTVSLEQKREAELNHPIHGALLKNIQDKIAESRQKGISSNLYQVEALVRQSCYEGNKQILFREYYNFNSYCRLSYSTLLVIASKDGTKFQWWITTNHKLLELLGKVAKADTQGHLTWDKVDFILSTNDYSALSAKWAVCMGNVEKFLS